MSKIIYMLGAGASYGERGEGVQKIQTASINAEGAVSYGKECAKINRGVPIVSEIPGRLDYMISKLSFSSESKHLLPETPNRRQILIDLNWLREETAKHATIDTFAKKLFVTGDKSGYQKLKNLLLLFLYFEQIVNEPDSRYDSFLASVMQNDVNTLPEDISVVSWNYDFQFELAYRSYVPTDALEMLSEYYIHSYDKMSESKREGTYKRREGFQLVKLNGTAFKKGDRDFFRIKKEKDLEALVDMYPTLNTDNNRISFAWESMNEQFVTRLTDCVKDARVLIIIGYSFPFFNRQVDRLLFSKMPMLKKIYIQDPHASNVKMSLLPVLSEIQRSVNHVDTHIEMLHEDPRQFYLPPEL